MTTRLRAAAVAFGALFGFALGWARLTDFDVIHRMLRLQEPDVFLLMGSAIATAGICARVLRALGVRSLVDRAPVSWATVAPNRDHVVGSALFGLGWSVACTCPGPIAAQLGRGQWVALLTGSGLLAGIALQGALKARAGRRLELESQAPVPPETACAGL